MGLSFEFSEENKLIRKSVKRFAEENLEEIAEEVDEKGEFPRDIVREMSEKIGVPGSLVPEKYGGGDADYVTLGIALEEIAKVETGAAYSCLCDAVSVLLKEYGKDQVKEEWLPKVAEGEALINVANTEPECGTDATAIKTTAKQNRNNYILNGTKSSISLADSADAFILTAKTSPDKKAKGISTFLVPRKKIEVSLFDDLGARGIERGELYLDEVEVPDKYLLGKEGEGFRNIMESFDFIRPLTGIYAVAVATDSIEKTIEYVKERKAFDRPIAKFEGVQFPIAEHHTKIEAAKLLCYRALWKAQNNLPHTKDAAMAKYFAAESAAEATHDCLILHGNAGYQEEGNTIPRKLRDSIGLEIGDGTPQIQKIVIARELLGREYLPYR